MGNYKHQEHIAGGFSPRSGTIDFYLRVSTFLNEKSVAVDLGAGRGAWYYTETNTLARKIRDVKSQVKTLIGVDVDAAVMSNPTTTENRVIKNGQIPLDDQSVDIIFSDYVIEHISDVDAFKSEVDRVLKPGGTFCARTPHSYCYVSLAARIIPNSRHAILLKEVQPERNAEDVFPTFYRMNTLDAIHRTFDGWKSGSFIYRTEPSYNFGSAIIYSIVNKIHAFMPAWFSGNLMIFLTKPTASFGTDC
jgi:SAM-dependent methyltransferase